MFLDSDGVENLAGVWGCAAEGLREQRDKLRQIEMRAESFGAHYAEQMADVGPAVERLAGRMHDWGSQFDDYREKLRGTIATFIGLDEGNAGRLRGGDQTSGRDA